MAAIRPILLLGLGLIFLALPAGRYFKFKALYESGVEGLLIIEQPLNSWGKRVLDTTRVIGSISGKKSIFVLRGDPTFHYAGSSYAVIYFPSALRAPETFSSNDNRAGLQNPEAFTTGVRGPSFRWFYKVHTDNYNDIGISVIFGLLCLGVAIYDLTRPKAKVR